MFTLFPFTTFSHRIYSEFSKRLENKLCNYNVVYCFLSAFYLVKLGKNGKQN